MYKWYMHFVVLLVTLFVASLVIPTLISQASTMAVLLGMALILVLPVFVGLYFQKVIFSTKKDSKKTD